MAVVISANGNGSVVPLQWEVAEQQYAKIFDNMVPLIYLQPRAVHLEVIRDHQKDKPFACSFRWFFTPWPYFQKCTARGRR